MKHLLIIATIVLSVSVNGFSQAAIPAAAAGNNIGKTVTVCDKVFGGRYLESANGTPTLINMGAAYPNNPFTFVIMGDDRKKFSYKPEEYLLNKEVCVTGEIKEYKGKPQIIVSDTTQVVLKK
jgi:hypothetical protein